ncbi:MAG TPA: branched-chain amino acid ABC transporter permease [Pyrinomonadaceae bacterium]|jgi:branched-chain amino acid transport system permease protein
MEYLLHILIITGIYIILTLSLNLILGYTGLPNLGHAAFYCVGAYTSSLLALNFGFSPWLGLLFGACLAALLGSLVALPSLRIKDDYLALTTFGLGVIVYTLVKNWVPVTRGPMGLFGIPPFSIFGFQLSATWLYLFIVILFVFLTLFTIRRVVNSRFGRILRGIRDDELAVMSLAKNVNSYKIQVFIIGAFFAGIAGSLYAHYITFIDPSTFTITESIAILLMVVFGGLGNLSGSFIGASILVVFPEVLRLIGLPSPIAASLRQMLYGLLLVILMVKRPQGIIGRYKIN